MHKTAYRMAFALALVAAACLPGRAAEYFVSPSGDDAASGSRQAPWRSITRVNAVDLQPGDRVRFEGGQVFTGTLVLDEKDAGLEEKPVTVTSYGEGRAVIDGGTGDALSAKGCDFLTVTGINCVGAGRKQGSNGSGIRLQDLRGGVADHIEVSGFRGSGVEADGVHDTRITNVYAHENGFAGISVGYDAESSNVYIAHCRAVNNPGDPENLTNHSGNGIVVGNIRDSLIEYCVASNNGWDMPREGNGPVGIWAWKADHVVIQHCIAYGNKSPGWDGGGFDLDGGATNCILQYNLSYDNVGPGYLLCQYEGAPEWRDNIVRYNISQNDGSGQQDAGIRLWSAETGGISSAEIYNNVVYNDTGWAVDFGGDPIPGIRFRNNVFIGAKGHVQGDYSDARFEGNLYWHIGPPLFVAGAANSLDEWVATGQEVVGGRTAGIYADPLIEGLGRAALTDPALLRGLKAYRLQAGSPCAGAGQPVENAGGRDLFGEEVPAGGGPCIGVQHVP